MARNGQKKSVPKFKRLGGGCQRKPASSVTKTRLIAPKIRPKDRRRMGPVAGHLPREVNRGSPAFALLTKRAISNRRLRPGRGLSLVRIEPYATGRSQERLGLQTDDRSTSWMDGLTYPGSSLYGRTQLVARPVVLTDEASPKQ